MCSKVTTTIQNTLSLTAIGAGAIDFSKLNTTNNSFIGNIGTYILTCEEPLIVTLKFYADGRHYSFRHTVVYTSMESKVDFFTNHPEDITIFIKPGEKHFLNAKNSTNNICRSHLCAVDIEKLTMNNPPQ